MKELNKYFEHYTIKARFKSVFLRIQEQRVSSFRFHSLKPTRRLDSSGLTCVYGFKVCFPTLLGAKK